MTSSSGDQHISDGHCTTRNLFQGRGAGAASDDDGVLTLNTLGASPFCSKFLLSLTRWLAGYGLASSSPFSTHLHKVGFAFIMTLTLYVIFDLDHPRFGLIRVDFADQAIEDIRSSMK